MRSSPQIDKTLRHAADLKEVPGVVAVAASGRETIYEGAFGRRDLAKDESMALDSVFWIASMTKAITGGDAACRARQAPT
jgi:CubicO group peptidase (beta-lactamase class C family)